jgi:hypothetical protein
MQRLNMRKINIFIHNTIFAIGTISSFVTIFGALFPIGLADFVKNSPWAYLAIIFVVAGIYGGFTIREKNQVQLKLSDRVKANVFFGDIFQQNEITVIPVNDYFDTLVDDNVVSSNTLHGKFIKNVFGGNEANLKEQIESSLSEVKPIDVNSNRKIENNKKYPLGTVCEVKHEGKVFYLVALTRFNENHRAEITNSEYQDVLCRLFEFIEQKSQGRKVNIPLIGAGHSGCKISKQKLLEFLLFSIALSDNLTLIKGVNVVLHDTVKDEIDLSMTEILFKGMED